MRKIIYTVLAASVAFSGAFAATKNTVKKTTAATSSAAARGTAAIVPLEKFAQSGARTATTMTAKEKEAVNLYLSAYENYFDGKKGSALKQIEQAEAKLGKTTARTSYLKAKIAYEQGDYTTARAACLNYFNGNPAPDAGYAEMQTMRDQLSAYFSKQDELKVAAERERQEALQASLQAQKDAAAKEQEDIENSKKKRENARAQIGSYINKIQSDLNATRAANTRDAYENFLQQYPWGKAHYEAQKEMKAKWPSPVRRLGKKNKYGYVNSKGDFVIKAKYDNASEFENGMARVGNNGKYGFINEKGEEVIPIIYKNASNFNYGYAAVKDATGGSYLLSKTGKKLDDKKFSDVKSFSEGLAPFSEDGYRYGYLDPTGDVRIESQFEIANLFHEGKAVVGKNINGAMRYAFLQKNGEMLTGFDYEDAKDFQFGLARVKKGGKYGLIDFLGGTVTGCDYDFITDFGSDGYARAKRDNMNILLDREGSPWAKVNGKIIPVKFKTN